MAVLKSSVEADVPIAFADEEWTEYVYRSLYGNYQRGFEDVAVSLAELGADTGTVTFETEPDGRVRIAVEAEYTPQGRDPSADVARAESALRADLEKFRIFLLRRCDQESCRSN
jgi:hypothetical protein